MSGRAFRPGLAALCAVLAMPLGMTCGAATAAAAETDFSYCIVCHGAQGNGNPAIRAPKIAGMERWYVTRQLQAFREGIRGGHPADEAGHEMHPVGIRLKDDATLARAVAYVATLTSQAPPLTVAGNVDRGKELYAACQACHGARGEGNQELNAPALSARTDWYMVTQMKNYRNGLRGTNAQDTFGAQMRAVATALPDDQSIDDVIAYINTLR